MKKILVITLSIFFSANMLAQQMPTMLKNGKADSKECQEWVNDRLNKMSLKEKIGQLFVAKFAPNDTPANRKKMQQAIKTYKLGGLLFSGGQLVSQAQLTNFAQQQAKLPLLITFDGEWGLAMRLKPSPVFPKNRVLGAVQDNELIYKYGLEVAREMREMGVHVNFAPDADIDVNPFNPVINVRSWGGDKENVAAKSVSYAKGLEDGGVLSVCKHFPGHGDTDVDSHKSLPTLAFDRERLDDIELYPFKQAIQAGLSGIMVGHLEVPALSKEPASVSHEIVTDLLQNELGFQGLVFTDALEMKGITSKYRFAAAKALMAGNDCLLVQTNIKGEFDAVMAAVRKGEITEDFITEKCRKVLTYKYILGLTETPHIQLSGLVERINTPESAELITDLYKAALTVPVNKMLPIDARLAGTTVLQIGNSNETTAFANRLGSQMQVTIVNAAGESALSLGEKLMSSKRVFVAIYDNELVAPYTQLMDEAKAMNIPVVLAYFTPLKQMNELTALWEKADAVVMANTDADALQMQVADMMVGRAEATGRIPVSVGSVLKPGDGMTVDANSPRTYRPEDYGMSSAILARIDDIAAEGIKEHAFPGCQVLIMKEGVPVFDRCYGKLTYDGNQPVVAETMYDLASLSKTTATLMAVMKLYDEGKLSLTDKIEDHVPVFKGTLVGKITVRNLLFHETGLPPSWPFYENLIDPKSYKGKFFTNKPDANHKRQADKNMYVVNNFSFLPEYASDHYSETYCQQMSDSVWLNPAFHEVCMKVVAGIRPGAKKYVYSCLNFAMLKEIVEHITGMNLDEFTQQTFYRPMGMEHTMYLPLRKYPKSAIAPIVNTDFLRGEGDLQGFVHDELAATMGGISGNAGLYSCSKDIAKIYQMLLDGGMCDGKRYLSKETVDLFLTMRTPISRRGLGWDKPHANVDLSPCCEGCPMEVVGHTGFTGTCTWIDPTNNLVYVFLCNRLYPKRYEAGQLSNLNIRPRIQEVMYQALTK